MKIEGDYTEQGFGEVRIDGTPLDPRPSLAVRNHSPDGFAWGYGGSGPAQLALGILLTAGVATPLALVLYQDFKFQFIAPLPQASFTLELDVVKWARCGGARDAVRARTEKRGPQ